MAHFDTGEPHCPPNVKGRCNLTKCSCGKIWGAMHRQEIRNGEPSMSTYLVAWKDDISPVALYATVEAYNQEDAVWRYEEQHPGTQVIGVAQPIGNNGWSRFYEVEPPSRRRVTPRELNVTAR